MPDKLAALDARLAELKAGFWSNKEKGINACPKNITGLCACWMAQHVYKGYMGPYQEVSLTPSYPTPPPTPPVPTPPPTPKPSDNGPCSSDARTRTPAAGQHAQLDSKDQSRIAKQQWALAPVSGSAAALFTIELASTATGASKLCLGEGGSNGGQGYWAVLVTCNSTDPKQTWTVNTGGPAGVASTPKASVALKNTFAGRSLNVQGGKYNLITFKAARHETNSQFVLPAGGVGSTGEITWASHPKATSGAFVAAVC